MSELATVTRADAQGMITLRADLSSKTVKQLVKSLAGEALPAPGRMAGSDFEGAAWMSPDELMIFFPYKYAPGIKGKIEEALTGTHFLAENVSDARARFTVKGAGAREVLARLCPVDLHKSAFGPGDFRRTRLAQVAAAFWMVEEGKFEVICFRSVADYVEGLLMNAAKGTLTGALG